MTIQGTALGVDQVAELGIDMLGDTAHDTTVLGKLISFVLGEFQLESRPMLEAGTLNKIHIAQ